MAKKKGIGKQLMVRYAFILILLLILVHLWYYTRINVELRELKEEAVIQRCTIE
jgi:hypothetical protein